MFSNITQVKQYIAANHILQITRYVDQTHWTISLDTARKKRFIQKTLADQILVDPIINGIPIVSGKWPSYR